MRLPEVSIFDLLAAEAHLAGCVEGFGRKGIRRPWLVVAVLPLAVEVSAEPEFRIFVRDDLRPGLSNRFIRAGMVRMPIGIKEDLNALVFEFLAEELHQLGGSLGRSAIDHQETIRAGKDEDIAAGSRDLREIVAELRGRYLLLCEKLIWQREGGPTFN